MYRTGKSSLMNWLLDRPAGFAVGPTVQRQTRGKVDFQMYKEYIECVICNTVFIVLIIVGTGIWIWGMVS